MEHSMTPYATYATNRPAYGAGKTRAEQEREALRQQKEECEAHVRRAKAVTAVADHIVANNMKMIAGLKASLAIRVDPPPENVDFLRRNIARVGPLRSIIGAREQRLMARAEVMAAATAHLGDSSPTYRSPNQQRALYQPTPVDTSADLVRAARDEVERGMRLSAQEVHSRRAPPKLQGLGHAGWKI
jgi:hypothetical protein